MLELPLARWEYRELYEKNENFNVVHDAEGNPKVADAWVVVYLRMNDGTEIPLDIDRDLFDRYLLPGLGDRSVR